MVDIAVSIVTVPRPCNSVSPILPVLDRHVQRSAAGDPGSEDSPGCLLQDINVQGLVSGQLLQLSVLLLEMPEASDLLDRHPTVFHTSTLIGQLLHTDLSSSLCYRYPMLDINFCLSQEVDDLF